MQALAETVPLFAFLDAPEIFGIAIIILVLLGGKHLPTFLRGLRLGMKDFDEAAKEAGQSASGICGKPAAEALTPENQTAELYDPAVFHRKEPPAKPRTSWLNRLWSRILDFFRKSRP